MTPTNVQDALTLPEPLRLQFQRLERRLRKTDAVVTLSGALGSLLLAYGFLFVSDRFWDTPVWLRSALVLTGLASFLGFGARWLIRHVLRRPDLLDLSVLVQRHYRNLGDRLLGIVELADDQKRSPNISPALCRAAIAQVADEAGRVDFKKAVASRYAKIGLGALLLLAGVSLVPWLLVPQAGWNALIRGIHPLAPIARYTFVSMDALPAEMVVPHGEPFEIQCTLAFHSFWHPTRATGQYGRQTPLRATVRGNQVLFRIPGQTQKDVLKLCAGDITREITVLPTYRPELKQLEARIQRPDYLHYPVTTEKIATGSLAILEGSSVAFHGKASRTLASATLAVERAAAAPIEVKGDEFSSALLNLAGVSRCVLVWSDTLGLDGPSPLALAVRSEKDLSPAAECRDLAAATAILEHEVLDIQIAATDDYGVREIGVGWDYQKRKGVTGPAVRQRFSVQDGAFEKKELDDTFRFCPSVLHIPAGTLVTLRALATDYFPNRPPSESVSYQIYVLEPEEHARLIQQRLEALLSRLEELTRKQEELQNASREVQQMPPEKMAADETSRQLGEQSADEKRYAEELERMAAEVAESLREALRNPELTEESLREWMQHLQSMKALSQKEMQAAIQALKSAQQKAEDRKPQVDRAVDQEQAVLKALQELLKNMGGGLDRMQAQNLARRLRKVGGTEKEIKDQLQKIFPETVGMDPRDLPAGHRETVNRLSSDQEGARKEAQTLKEEIARFFERTRLSNYGSVNDDMEAARPGDEMSKVSDAIKQNKSVEAMQQAEAWAQRFKQWAEKLEAGGDQLPPPSGGSPGELTPEQIAQMMRMAKNFLKLARLRQEEENLRDRTRLTEEQKANNPNYREDARKLADQQRRLNDEIQNLQQDPDMAPAMKPLKDIEQAMGEAEGLLQKPQTDQPTVSTETTVIELLSNLMDAMQRQAAAMGGMAFLLPMGGGNTGTGNPGHSASDRENTRANGDPRGRTPEERRVDKMSGREGLVLPMEFRDALEGYFNAVDQTGP